MCVCVIVSSSSDYLVWTYHLVNYHTQSSQPTEHITYIHTLVGKGDHAQRDHQRQLRHDDLTWVFCCCILIGVLNKHVLIHTEDDRSTLVHYDGWLRSPGGGQKKSGSDVSALNSTWWLTTFSCHQPLYSVIRFAGSHTHGILWKTNEMQISTRRMMRRRRRRRIFLKIPTWWQTHTNIHRWLDILAHISSSLCDMFAFSDIDIMIESIVQPRVLNDWKY